jgi:hypothetical protein
MPGYLDLARKALASLPPKPEYELNEEYELIRARWDQAEAERLLAQLREALARVDADVAAGKASAVRAAAIRTWLEVAEGYVKDRDLEAARGWDALELLRGAVARAVGLATPPTHNPCL